MMTDAATIVTLLHVTCYIKDFTSTSRSSATS